MQGSTLRIAVLALACLSTAACRRAEGERPATGSASEPAPTQGDGGDAATPKPAVTGSATVEARDAGQPSHVIVREETHRSTITISVAAPPSEQVNAAIDEAFAEVARLESVMSDWRDESELSALNKRAGTTPMHVGDELFTLLRFSRELGERSHGAFDITFASLGGLWSFRPGEERLPTKAEVAKKLPLIDYRRLRLDEKAHTALLEQPGSRAGLGALGDGYAALRASQVLTKRGLTDHLVLASGDGCASGRRFDRRWRVGVRDPQTMGIWGTVELADEGIATSGNYQKAFIKDGVRYHHIMNPKTGFPARGTASVTVLAKDALLADGWATTLFVLGPKEGLEVAKREGLEALWFDEEFNVSGTPGMLARVQRVGGEPEPDAGSR